MKIKPFLVEEWMNEFEEGARWNIAETCVDSVSVDELFRLCGEDRDAFFRALTSRRLTYGSILGDPEFKEGVAKLFRGIAPEQIVTTHGAAGANHHVFYSLIEPGDKVVSVMPTYQQLYSIPESFGADLRILPLKEEDGFLPDIDALRALVTPDTKMICVNNPNNPTGALMDESRLREIAEIARSAGAYLLCDEVYRGLTQEDRYQVSVAEIYEKGISVGSMSKVFSLAGLRLGWIVSRAPEVIEKCLIHRDYNHISCGLIDEALAAVALRHKDRVMGRSLSIVRENLRILDDWVAGEPRLRYVKPAAGTTALIFYDYDPDSYEFCRQMYDATGAFVTPGDCFGQKKCLRVGYACDRETLMGGLKAFSAFLRQLEQQKEKE